MALTVCVAPTPTDVKVAVEVDKTTDPAGGAVGEGAAVGGGPGATDEPPPPPPHAARKNNKDSVISDVFKAPSRSVVVAPAC